MPTITLEYGHPSADEHPRDDEIVLCLWRWSVVLMQYSHDRRLGHGWHERGADYVEHQRQPWVWVRLPAAWVGVLGLDWTKGR